MFSLYFKLGIEHILDFAAYDHIVFILALCAIYSLEDWRKVGILVTSFTIGHSLTLALATLQLIEVDTAWVEFLIPVTIVVTATENIISKKSANTQAIYLVKYATALVFGLIHGMGFSGYLISLLGEQGGIVLPLLAFNTGLEIGQLAIVSGMLALTWLITIQFKIALRKWSFVISAIALVVSLFLLFERLPALLN